MYKSLFQLRKINDQFRDLSHKFCFLVGRRLWSAWSAGEVREAPKVLTAHSIPEWMMIRVLVVVVARHFLYN